jgi:hypothetical protein
LELEILTNLLVHAFNGCDRGCAEHAANYLLTKGVTVKNDIYKEAKGKIRALELQNQYLTGMIDGFKLALRKGETYGKEKHTAGR